MNADRHVADHKVQVVLSRLWLSKKQGESSAADGMSGMAPKRQAAARVKAGDQTAILLADEEPRKGHRLP